MCVHFTTSNQALMNSAPAKNVSGTNLSETDNLKVPRHGFNIRAELKVRLSYNFRFHFFLKIAGSMVNNLLYCGTAPMLPSKSSASLEVLNCRLQTNIIHKANCIKSIRAQNEL